MRVIHQRRGAKRAREARGRWGLGERERIPCLLEVAEAAAGAHVFVHRIAGPVEGAHAPIDGSHLVHVDASKAAVRCRFTLAHELGHIVCGHDPHGGAVDSGATLDGSSDDPREIEANAFAGELLVPRAAIAGVTECNPHLEAVVRLACEWGVSAGAMLYRLWDAGLLDRDHSNALWAEVNEGLHLEVERQLGLERPADGLDDALDGLPYLSPALEDSTLEAVLEGRYSVEEAAAYLGVDAEVLRYAVEGCLAG